MDKWAKKTAGRIETLRAAKRLAKGTATKHLIDAYGKLIKDDGSLPHRSSFRPEEVRRYMSQLVLYEVPRVGSPIYRLVGSQIRAEFATDPIGRAYAEFVDGDRIESACAAFWSCCFTRCAMLVYVDHVRKSGKATRHEVLGLPFNTDDPDVGYLLFSDSILGESLWKTGEEDDTVQHALKERSFIDLGFGTPTDHVDLYPRVKSTS